MVRRVIKGLSFLIIMGLVIYPSSLLNIHLAWIISISIVWFFIFSLFSEIALGVYFFINPKKILTDHGYNYIRISKSSDGNGIDLDLFVDKFFYWKHINESKLEHSSVCDESKLKNQINLLCAPKDLTPFQKVVKSFNEIDIATDRKELIRELNIDKVLDDG